MLDAVAVGDVAVWRTYVDATALHVDEAGTPRTREELLTEMHPLPPGLVGRLQVASMRIERGDGFAVVTHEDHEELNYFGQHLTGRYRTTDTWRRTQQGWKIIATQVLALPDDPPVARGALEESCPYEGVYALTDAQQLAIRCSGNALISERPDRPAAAYRPELRDVFFMPGQPRTRRIFIRDESGVVVAFVDRREGHDIRWERR
ncbi:MAG: nuclear transport factor 2 family protein [Terricaulis sp.]